MDPRNKFAYYNLGLIDQQAGNNVAAEKEYRQALSLDANFDRAMFNLAILRTPADPNEAATLYRKVIAIDPNWAGAHLNLGFVLISTGQSAEGRSELDRAVAIDPTLAPRVKVAPSAPAPSPSPAKKTS
jgi:tetratricopeptide (TPR) repeat protein